MRKNLNKEVKYKQITKNKIIIIIIIIFFLFNILYAFI